MAANVQKVDLVDIELNSGNIHRSWMKQSIGSADVKGNAFGVRVFRDGEGVTLSSVSVYGYFRDPRGNNIAITTGNTVSGNTAYVVLPAACYNYEGQFCLAIKLIGGGVTGTMRIVDGMVDNTHTGGAVAPTAAVPSYSEILETYDEMVAATAVANVAIAPEYDDLTFPVAAGTLCIYNGGLYQASVAISTSEVWTPAHWTETTFGDRLRVEALARVSGDADVLQQIAPVFQKSSANNPGTYVTYEGALYYLPNGHTANAEWSDTTKTAIKVGSALSTETLARASGDADVLLQIAPVFQKTSANAAGTYVTYEGALYYLPNGHTANAEWADTTKTAVKIANEVSSVKSAITKNQKAVYDYLVNGEELLLLLNYEYGMISSAGEETYEARKYYCRSVGYFSVDNDMAVGLNVLNGSSSRIFVARWNKSTGTFVDRTGFQPSGNPNAYTFEDDYLYRIAYSTSDSVVLPLDNLNAYFKIDCDKFIDGIKSDIANLGSDDAFNLAYAKAMKADTDQYLGRNVALNRVKTIYHGGVAIADTKTPFSANKGDKISINVSGTGFNSATCTLYVWTDSSTYSNAGSVTVGTERVMSVPNDIVAVSIYAASSEAGYVEIRAEVVQECKQTAKFLTNSPVNLIRTPFVPGTYNASGFVPATGGNAAAIAPFPVTAGGKYTMWWTDDAVADGVYYYLVQLDSDGERVTASSGMTKSVKKYTVTLEDDCVYCGICTYVSAGSDQWANTIPSKMQFEIGDNQSEYDNPKVIKREYISSKEVYEKLYNDGYLSGSAVLHDYYYTDNYIQNKAARINAVGSSIAGNGDVFLFITDEHWTQNAKQSPKLIGYLNKHCCFNRIFNGGDMFNRDVTPEFFIELRGNYDHNIHTVMGNHEYSNSDENEVYYWADTFNDNQIGNPQGHYYYVDNPQMKIRYIVLKSYKVENNTVVNDYNATQLAWLTDVALDVESGWSIIVFSHDFGSTATGISAYYNALDSAKTGGKDIIAVFNGHFHYDAIWHTPGGIPIIVTTCDKNQAYYNGDVNTEPWLTEQRQTGTIYEQAFDVVAINRESKTIRLIRIGGLAMDNVDKKLGETGFTTEGTLEERVVSYT